MKSQGKLILIALGSPLAMAGMSLLLDRIVRDPEPESSPDVFPLESHAAQPPIAHRL